MTSRIALYSRVELTTNKHNEQGISLGARGYVIEVYADGNCEVEFSDAETGITIAQVVVASEDIVACDEG